MSTQKGNGMADEMKVVETTAPIGKSTFATRLRDYIEKLPDGKTLELTTKEDRQVITNVVSMLKKKQGMNLSTKVLTSRNEVGQYKIAIEKKAPVQAPAAAA